MKQFIENFISYLVNEKDSSPLTIAKYKSDLNRLIDFLNSAHKISNINEISTNIIRDLLSYLKQTYPYKSSAMANKINIIKHFFSFAYKSGYISSNPANLLSCPKKIKKLPKVLNEIELAKLLKAPDYIKSSREKKNTVRDRLILTMLAYTGIRRSDGAIFLGLMDLLYNLEHKMFTPLNAESTIELIIIIVTLSLGSIMTVFLWKHRKEFLK
jgi:site-specific recombinase XerD